jgi:polyisoprenoid-binding protein YceI
LIHTRTAGRPRTGSYVIIAATLVSVLLFLAGVGIWYQFFRDDSPPPVSLSSAVSSLDDATPTATTQVSATAEPSTEATATGAPEVAATTTPEAATTDAASTGLDGDWTIDTALDTFVGYRVGEELANVGTTEAVGRTSTVTGGVTVEDGTVISGMFEADLTTLESDKSMRDGQLGRQGIETDTYPTATFTLTQPLALDATLADGEAVQATAVGELTLHGVTNSVEIPLEIQASNGVIVVVGSLDIAFADYNIAQPSSMRVLSIDDHGVLELQLFFVPA